LPEQYEYFVGVDWATERHQVCVLGSDGQPVAERIVEHSGAAQREFVQWLTELVRGRTWTVAIAIELPRGALVEGCVERKFAVFAINPKQLDRFRDRYSVAGAKDDSRDAFVLADSLRTDRHCFHEVALDDAVILQIREMSRVDDELQCDFARLANQLREQLLRYYPQMLKLNPAADEPWLWDLLEMAPLPAKTARLSKSRVEKLLRNHRIRRMNVDQVLQQLRAPALALAPGADTAASKHALLLLPRLRILRSQRKQVAKDLAEHLQQLPFPSSEAGEVSQYRDLDLILSFPGLGNGIAATILAEASQALAKRDYHALRCYAGIAPVTRQSGKKRSVGMRYACNPRLRNAFYHWSRCSIQRDLRSQQHYAELRARGHSHGRALRGLADRLLIVLIAMLKNHTPYDRSLRPPRSANDEGSDKAQA
jgi:transposase